MRRQCTRGVLGGVGVDGWAFSFYRSWNARLVWKVAGTAGLYAFFDV